MDSYVEGVDASYTGLKPEHVPQLKNMGVRVWIQCLWTGKERPASAYNNLKVAREGGLWTAGYISTNGSWDGAYHVARGYQAIPWREWEALTQVFADVELDGISNIHVREMVDGIYRLGKPRSIYTSHNAWVNKQGNPTNFTDCLLYNAFWDEDHDFDFVDYPYGNWKPEQVVVEQYTGGREILPALYVDRDIINLDLFLGQQEDEMTAEEQKRLKDAENLAHFNQEILKIVVPRTTYHEEVTRKMWREVFGEDMPDLDGKSITEQLYDLDERLKRLEERKC